MRLFAFHLFVCVILARRLPFIVFFYLGFIGVIDGALAALISQLVHSTGLEPVKAGSREPPVIERHLLEV